MSKVKVWRNVTGYLIGLFALSIIGYFGGKQALKTTFEPRIDFLLVHILATILAWTTSAVRWGHIVNTLEGKKVCSFYHYFVFLVTGRFFGLYISRAGGDLLLRPGLLNRVSGVTLKKSFYSTFLEKFLDSIFLFIFIIPSSIFLLNMTSIYGAIGISGLLLLILFYLLVMKKEATFRIQKRIVLFTLSTIKKVPFLNKLSLVNNPRNVNNLESLALINKRTISIILLLTCIRYIFLISRLYFLVLALGLSIPLSIVIFGLPVVQFGLLFGFTPGGLGVLEGGWYAVFALTGIAQEDRLAFLLAQRIYLILLTTAVFLINYLIVGIEKWGASGLSGYSLRSDNER
jgi:uncharacterized protein (TIRG00374 family)